MKADYAIIDDEFNWNKSEKKSQEPCAHDSCPECRGSGRKQDGTVCVHMISCPCPKCNPTF